MCRYRRRFTRPSITIISTGRAAQPVTQRDDRSGFQKGEAMRNLGDVGVVILNWNGGEETARCLESLSRSDYPHWRAIVIDNGSTDGSVDEIAQRFPEVDLIRNPRNFGFAEASNQGAKRALERGDAYVLFLNSDTTVDPAMVSRLVAAAAEHNGLAAVSPLMLQGVTKRIWFGVGRVDLWKGVFSNPMHNFAPAEALTNSLVQEMEFASGCCVLVPRGILRTVGGFDPRFFAYCEDIDWSIRCRRAGFQLLLCPQAVLWHGSPSGGRKHYAMTRYLLTRNHLWTLRKHASALQMLCALLWLPPRSAKRMLDAVRQRQWARVPAELKGLRDGLIRPAGGIR